jgi:hypothetical protein
MRKSLPARGRFPLLVRQRGQALAFIGVTTVVVLLGLLLLYNVAQLTTQKMKLQNTADAAAYSGALTEARDYNFTAYANRAMIANQVAVAQIVGLRSWARNLDSVYKSGPFNWVPQTFASLSSLGSMWTTVWNVAKSAAGGIESVMNAVAGPLVKVLDLLIDALYYGSTAYHIAMILTVPETVVEVIEKNDPDASLSTSLTQIGFAAKHALDVYGFTSDYDPTKSGNDDNKSGSSKDRQSNVIFNSQDGFYNFRSYPWPLPILIDPTKAIPGNFGTMFMIMYHSGGTELKNKTGTYMKSWTGADATGLFTILMVWIFVPFPVPIPIPIPTPQGYGAALAGSANDLQPGTGNFNHNFAEAYGSAFVNPLTMAPAWINVGAGTGATLDSNGGLKKYWDVTDRDQASATAHQNTSGPELLIEVEKPMSKIAISSSPGMNIGGGDTGQLWLADGTQGNTIKALSKAQSYFARPPKLFARGDGKTEYGSLYSPYWQARLMHNNLLEQGASILSQSWP